MARRKQSTSLEERLIEVIKDIENTEHKLKTLKQTKEDLEEAIKQKKLTELYEIVQASGKTIDEVKDILTK